MRRIALAVVLALGSILVPLVGEAQQAGRVWRIGSLNTSPIPVPGQNPIWDSFMRRMRELGYIDGQNFSIEFRTTGGPADRLPELAAELVRLKVDLILAPATQAALAAKQATTTIPIVMAAAVNPVETGLVASLARPGETSRG
jgi:ABC-type uncharacterized transport system substrate-binding protein